MDKEEQTLTRLPNIGNKLALALEDAGIFTPEQLFALGSKEAFVRLRLHDNTACLCKLSALEGAIRGIRWHDLDSATKSELKAFFNKL